MMAVAAVPYRSAEAKKDKQSRCDSAKTQEYSDPSRGRTRRKRVTRTNIIVQILGLRAPVMKMEGLGVYLLDIDLLRDLNSFLMRPLRQRLKGNQRSQTAERRRRRRRRKTRRRMETGCQGTQ